MSFGPNYDFSSNVRGAAPPVPQFLGRLQAQVASWLGIAAGTALGWHRDVPDCELVCGISLGGPCRMRFRPFPPRKNRKEVLSLELSPRSAYVLRDEARWRWQHSIPGTKVLRYLLALLLAAPVVAQQEPANGILLVAKPGLTDPNFRETVVLVTQAADASTVGVILNRPTPSKHEKTGEPLYFGGPVMREVLVALFRSDRTPDASAFHVIKGVYLTMHPDNIERLLGQRGSRYRLYAGFSGWAPGQLESELARDGWYVQPASAELVFRKDTSGMWDELVRKARGRVAIW